MFVNYFLGTLVFIRMASAIFNMNLIINNFSQKALRNFFSCFFCFYLSLKLLNNIFSLHQPVLIVKVIEILFIFSVIIILFTLIIPISNEFVFNKKDELIPDIFRFFYQNKNSLNDFGKTKNTWSLNSKNSNKSKQKILENKK
jgi:hypothetical protein